MTPTGSVDLFSGYEFIPRLKAKLESFAGSGQQTDSRTIAESIPVDDLRQELESLSSNTQESFRETETVIKSAKQVSGIGRVLGSLIKLAETAIDRERQSSSDEFLGHLGRLQGLLDGTASKLTEYVEKLVSAGRGYLESSSASQAAAIPA